MEKENTHIEKLLDRFFEGETTNEEEQQLYLFFKQEKIPKDLIQYKSVVEYFENGLADELGYPTQSSVLPPRSSHKKQWILWSSIAASFLVILFSTLFFLKDTKPFDPYEGSYIVRNGVRITDMNLIRPELEATAQKALQQREEMERMVSQLTKAENPDALISQQIQEKQQRILAHFPDESVRKEVQQILNTNY